MRIILVLCFIYRLHAEQLEVTWPLGVQLQCDKHYIMLKSWKCSHAPKVHVPYRHVYMYALKTNRVCFVHSAAICSPPCQNDGDCIQPNTCQCGTSLWKGEFCEIGESAKYIIIVDAFENLWVTIHVLSLAVCRRPCLNGGECYRPLTEDRCRCVDGWSRDQCETRMCVVEFPLHVYLFHSCL